MSGSERREVPARIIEAGLLLILPLIFYRGFLEQFTYPKYLITEILVISGLAVLGLELVWGRLAWPKCLRLWLPLGSLACLVLISAANSPVPRFSLNEACYFLCGPVWILLLVFWNSGERSVARLASLIALGAALASAIALLQWAGCDPLLFGHYRINWGRMVPRMRLYSTFGNPNFLAGYLIGAVFLALALGAVASKLRAKAFWWGAAVLMLAAIAGAGSRGAWAALVAGIIAAKFVYGGRAGIVPVLSSALMPAIFVGTSFIQDLLGRLEGRIFFWRASWPMFFDHPLIGSGWGSYQLKFLDLQAKFLSMHPEWTRYWTNNRLLHNDPLQLLLETGLLGFAAFVWLLWAYGSGVHRVSSAAVSRSSRCWLAASSGGLAAILADSFFNYQFAVPPTFILAFTLIAFPFLQDTGGQRVRGRGVRLIRLAASAGILVCAALLLVSRVGHAEAERSRFEARVFEDRGEVDAAEKSYRRGLQLNPSDGRLHFGLARALFLSERYQEALSEVLLAERTYADSHTWVLKGHILKQLGRKEEAQAVFHHAKSLDPTLKTI